MLKKYMNKKEIAKHLVSYSPFENISNREYWDMLKGAGEEELCKLREIYDNLTYPSLFASFIRQFETQKNRSNYQNLVFQRRDALKTYTFSEAFYNNDEYIEKVVDFAWIIMEESSWAIPAHYYLNRSEFDSLPSHKEHILDLFSGDTAADLSFVYAVMKDKLDKISKNIAPRIKDEIHTRVIKNYLDNNEYWYMGYGDKIPNNWNPWINKNVLISTSIFSDDEEKASVIYKVLETLSNYIDHYPSDGACDEGPTYWFHAGICTLECAELLKNLTDGWIDIFKEEKIIQLADYITKVYISKDMVVGFSDSHPKIIGDFGSLYKFGKIMNNKKLLGLAKSNYQLYTKSDKVSADHVIRMCEKYKAIPHLKNEDYEFIFTKESYLESINLFVIRENEKEQKGLFLAAKGGHNGESHNHNDVGNFIVYKDGKPFIIDSGNMVYSALTFSSEGRYTIWTNISEYHNLPKINGKNQHQGKEFCSTDKRFVSDEQKAEFSLNIAETYENRQEINKWIRTIKYNKKENVIEITEDYSVKEAKDISLNFLTQKPIQITSKGFSMSDDETTLYINLDMTLFEVETEIIQHKDALLSDSWGDKLYRTILTLKNPKKEDIIKYKIF